MKVKLITKKNAMDTQEFKEGSELIEKFNPENFGYQISNEYDDCNVYNRLEVINGKERTLMLDLTLTLNYFKKPKSWIILVDGRNFKDWLDERVILDHYVVFMGFIETNADFKFIYDRIAKHPKEIIEMSYLSSGKNEEDGGEYKSIEPFKK